MVRLRALGPVQLTGDGDEKILSILAQPKRLALLVYLAAADPPGFHRRDELVALFWPERETARARAALRKSLHHLRKSLGAEALPGRGDEIRLDPELVWSDVQAFREAATGRRPGEALELYRGDLLEGFHAADCPGFEQWLEETRRELRRKATSVALDAAARKAVKGDRREAGELARRAGTLSPFDETVHREALRILGDIGDHSGALRFHERFAERMAEQLEVAPAPETERLVEEIRGSHGSGEGDGRVMEGRVTGSPAVGPADRPEESGERVGPAREASPPAPSGASGPVPAEAVTASRGTGWRGVLRSRAGVALVALLLGVLGVSAWVSWSSARQRWAFDVTLPEIQRLIDDRRMVAAHMLAREAEPQLEGNVEFERLLRQSLSPIPLSVRTSPPGARISVTDYDTPDGARYRLGTSPLDRVRIPGGALRLRVELPGFHTVERQLRTVGAGYDVVELEFDLLSMDEPSRMVRVPDGRAAELPPVRPPEELGAFWLDQYEVTNGDYAEFVRAGGYTNPDLWTESVVADGGPVAWERAMTWFVDRTGRPGPATWALGTFAEGAEDHPVGGVSWYEAIAYCRFVDKRLPTLHHWYKAAGLGGTSDLLSFGNLEGEGPMPVGSSRSVGSYGHVDMAGNVREWVLNPVGSDRYILGGAWSDSGYMFYLPDAEPPLDRSPTNGFRCARFPDEHVQALAAETRYLIREFEVEPLSDERFEAYRASVSYRPQPLNPTREVVDDALPYWTHEVVSFDAPYGSERIRAHLFLPKSVDPPYRAVVFYPGATPFRIESADDMETTWFDFLVRTGFAVIHPIYDGHFGREPSRLVREQVSHWVMEIKRSIDYLETRDDLDASRVAFYGHSFGAWNGPIFTAMEPRFKTSVFFAGGALERRRPPELQPLNHAPRTTVPVLMVNGRDDFYYGEAAQRRLFDLMGAPDEHKRHVMLEGGHFPGDWPAVMREIIDWLERYLGPAE